MSGKLPPLFSLQAFEAAARLGSFSKAADELSLTPGAISRQIRQLEDWCGQTLFARKGPSISLTNDGASMLARLDGPLAALHQAVFPRREEKIEHLQVATLASIAKEWLLPRLPSFTERHPLIQIQVQTDYALVRPAPRVPMVAIRHGTPGAQEVDCLRLFDDRLIAVASPRLLQELGHDTLQWPPNKMLSHVAQEADPWYALAGFPPDHETTGMACNDADVLLEAAALGLGIAVTRLSIAWRRLITGQLQIASNTICPSPRENLLVVREDCANLPAVRSFTEWLMQQASLWQHVQMEFDQPDHHLRAHLNPHPRTRAVTSLKSKKPISGN